MKRHSQQEIAALALKSEDVEIIGDKIGKRITELFQQVKQNRTTTRVMGKSIDSWFGKLERAYHKIHELSETEERPGMATYYGLIQQKTRMVSAFIRSKYVAYKTFPFSLEPTPIVELPKDKQEQGFQIVQSKLLQTMVNNGIPPDALVKDGVLIPSVARFIEKQSKESKALMREEEMKIAREASLNMTKLLQDQFVNANFEEAMSEFIDYLSLYPTAFMSMDYELATDYTWDKNEFKKVETVRPVFRAINPNNAYPFSDCTNANNGSGFIELIERSKAQIASFLGNEQLGYLDDAIHEILEKGDANWLGFDTDDAVARLFIHDTDLMHVLRCQTKISGADLLEYGLKLDGNEEELKYQYFDVDVEVCNKRVLKIGLIQSPHGKRTYFSASYKRVAGGVWGISPAMMIYDRQLSVNRIHYAMALNAYASSGEWYVINSDYFDRPEDVRARPFELYYTSAGQAATSGGVLAHQAKPTFAMLFNQMVNEIRLADDECGLPSFLNGNAGLQGAGQTLGGLAIMQDNAVMGLKDCFALIDMYIIRPIVQLMRDDNLINSKDNSIKGDAEVVATGLQGLEKDLEKSRVMAGIMPQMSALTQQGTIPQGLYQSYVRDWLNSQGIDTSKFMPDDVISGELGAMVSSNTPAQLNQLDGRSERVM